MKPFMRAAITALTIVATFGACGSGQQPTVTQVQLVNGVTPSAPLISTSTEDAAAQQAAQEAVAAKAAADAKAKAVAAKAAADAKAKAVAAKAAADAKAKAVAAKAAADAKAKAVAAKAAADAKAKAVAAKARAAAAEAAARRQAPAAPPKLVNTTAYFANCSAVRAAGAAPIHAGQPGYSRKLDRDGDGVACE